MLVKEKLMSQSINTLLLISSFLKHGQSNHMLTSVLLTISQSNHCLEMQPITLRHYRQRRQQSPMFPFYVANLILSDLFLVKCASVCSTHYVQQAQAARRDSAESKRNVWAHKAGDNKTLFSTSLLPANWLITWPHHPQQTHTFLILHYLRSIRRGAVNDHMVGQVC